MPFAYINTETLEYPVHEGDIRLLHPEIDSTLTGETFPVIAPFAPVEETPTPPFDYAIEVAEQIAPAQINGQWEMQWIVRPLTQAEKDYAAQLEAQRLAEAEAEAKWVAEMQAKANREADEEIAAP